MNRITTPPPFVSIVVPVYKSERYIKICIDSILSSTFQDFEVIIVDNAATDSSLEICQNLYGDNTKVRFVKLYKNIGPGGARAAGMTAALGKYIYFLDSDDVLLPDALYKMCTAAKSNDVDVVHMTRQFTTSQDDDQPIDATRLRLGGESYESGGFLSEDLNIRLANDYVKIQWMYLPFNLFKREFLQKNDIEFKDILGEDGFFIFSTLCFAKKIFVVCDVCYIYRIRDASTCHSGNIGNLDRAIRGAISLSQKMETVFNTIPELRGNIPLKEACLQRGLEPTFRDYLRPLYNSGVTLDMENMTRDTMFPIFHENTEFVKYLFHRTNIFHQQMQGIAQQNYLLQQQVMQLRQQLQQK